MALHFSRQEYAQRRQKTIEALQDRQLDGLLMFRQESMYYLSGYDSFGYVFFQCTLHCLLNIVKLFSCLFLDQKWFPFCQHIQ